MQPKNIGDVFAILKDIHSAFLNRRTIFNQEIKILEELIAQKKFDNSLLVEYLIKVLELS